MRYLSPKLTIIILLSLSLFLSIHFSLATTLNTSPTAKPTSGDPLKNGLVGWWTMDGSDVNATTITDKSGRGNDLSRDGVSVGVGKIGQGLKIKKGVTSYAYKNSASDLMLGNTGTISTWVKFSSLNLPNSSHYLLAYYPGVPTGGYLFNQYGTILYFYWAPPTGAPNVSIANAFVINTWYNIVLVNNNGALTGYINGVSRGTGTSGQAVTTTRTFTLGYDTNSPDMTIDETRVYNRALSATEVKTLYNQGNSQQNVSNPINLKNGLVGWWTFDGADVTSNTTTDRSGRGNNGTRNTTTVAVGKIGQAIKFLPTVGAFSSSSITIASNDTDFTTGAAGTFSFSFWIKPTALGGTFISRRHSCNNDGHFRIRMGTTGIVYLSFYSNLDTLASTYGSGNIISTGKWQYVTVTKQWGTANATKLYLNGVAKTFSLLAGSDTSQGTTYSSLQEVIGAEAAEDGQCNDAVTGPKNNFFNGSMDDVRIYNRALSTAEIKALYNQGNSQQNASNPINLKNGLVGWWTMDGVDVNATQVLDKSVSGNYGTRDTVFPGVGKIGQAMSFNGSSSKITLSQTPTVTYPLSISMWAKFSPSVTGLPHFLGLNTGAYPILYWSASTKQMLFYGANQGYQYSGVVANPQAWHLYTIVVPSTSASLIDTYIDGVKNEGTNVSTDVMVVPGATWVIGGSTKIFFGKIDDVRIYNRALSAAEIQALYNMGR